MNIWINKNSSDLPADNFDNAYIFSLNRKGYSTIFTNLSDTWLRLGALSIESIYEDLFIIAISIFAIDKRVSRSKFKDHWTRELKVSIPVIEIDKWVPIAKKWNELLNEVMEQKIKTIVITHKDRFVRFGYEWFEKFCMKFHTTIVVVNNEELSPQEELVQDIISILHVFSCRLYGLRKYKKQIERDEEIVKELQNRNESDRGTESQDT